MKFFTKKRVVLFLLFIFPLICFLLLSTGENNFTKLPVVKENILDIKEISKDDRVTFKNNITILTFLGSDKTKVKSGILNLNEKIYKKFIDYKRFQMIGIFPEGSETEINSLKEDLDEFTDLKKWKFVEATSDNIKKLFNTLDSKSILDNGAISEAYIIDKDGNLRGRLTDEDKPDGKIIGYNLNSVSELNGKMKDDISVLFYEYYAAFKVKNKNKADRKEVGL